jgi:phage shock protein C
MSAADEIAKLHELLNKGAISAAEFEQAKARLLAEESTKASIFTRFRLSNDERWIAGVCGGIEVVTGVDAWLWRVIFVLGSIFSGGAMAIFYLVLWIFVPREV